MDEVIGIIRTPSEYFSRLERNEISWFHALLGYYLVAFSEGAVNLLSMGYDLITALVMPGVGALLGGAFGIVLYGVIWFYLGSKLVGGSASLIEVVGAIGLALFWPGLFSLSFIPIMLVSSSQPMLVLAVVLIGQLALAAWSLFLSFSAIRQVADLSTGKAVVATTWFLAVIFLIGVMVAIVVPNIS